MTDLPDATDAPNKVGPVPKGYHTVTPFVIVKGAPQFIDFMKGGVRRSGVTSLSSSARSAAYRYQIRDAENHRGHQHDRSP